MAITEKLLAVQAELKAPKGQYNSFGKYKYRSCEDILEAVKPVLVKHKATITVSDDLIQIGNRFYVKATARFWDTEQGGGSIDNTAFAREPDTKKGMDESQITGTASSYARKYALNGLLLIDDTKDADTDENRNEREGRQKKQKQEQQKSPEPDRTGEPAYPPIEKMVSDIEAYMNTHDKIKAFMDGQMKSKGARDIHELAFTNEAFITACWNKWCNKG